MLELTLFRYNGTLRATNGWLSVAGKHWSYILERALKTPEGIQNVPRITALPAGVYDVELILSPKFNKVVPHILEPFANRDNFEIHCGEHVEDSEGCPLMGIKYISETEILSGVGMQMTENLVRVIKDAGGKARIYVINGPTVLNFLQGV